MKESIAITGTGAQMQQQMKQMQHHKKTDVRNKKVTLKHYGPFTDCINKTNNIQVDNAKYLDVVMPMHTLIEHTDNYTKLQKVHGSTTNMIQMKK